MLRVDTVTVAYAAPATGDKLQDGDNAQLPVSDFSAQTATNATPADTTGPVFVSASVNRAALKIVFDEALDEASVPKVGTFEVNVGGSRRFLKVGSATVAGRTVSMALQSPATHGQTVTVRYARVSGSAAIKDLSGNNAANFGNQSVTNNTPPAYSSASVNGSALTVTFTGVWMRPRCRRGARSR